MKLYEEADMFKRIAALAVILSLSLVLFACGGSDEEASGGEVAQTPAPTQVATATPQVATATPQAATATPQAESSPAATGGDASDSDEPVDLVEHLREKTKRLWDVYNMHDPEALEVFYEPGYWVEEVEEIRSNMQLFRSRNLIITAEETSPPTEISPGKWEIRQTASFTGGQLNMVFNYEEFDGEWLITFLRPQ